MESCVDCACEAGEGSKGNVCISTESDIGVKEVFELFVSGLSEVGQRIGSSEDLFHHSELLAVPGNVDFPIAKFLEDCVLNCFKVFSIFEDKISLINGDGKSGIEKTLRIN